jgi:hypothetical protein
MFKLTVLVIYSHLSIFFTDIFQRDFPLRKHQDKTEGRRSAKEKEKTNSVTNYIFMLVLLPFDDQHFIHQ